jgi:hypothetical protein
MNENFEVICRYFQNRDKEHFQTYRESYAISGVAMIVDGTAVQLVCHAPPDTPVVRLWCRPTVKVPKERRAHVGEYLHRVNMRLNYCNFGFDADGGDVFLVLTSLLPDDYTISEELFEEWLLSGMSILHSVMPVLMRVAFGNLSPVSGVEQTEAVLYSDRSEKGSTEE